MVTLLAVRNLCDLVVGEMKIEGSWKVGLRGYIRQMGKE